jgi:putative acetyltransferase
MRIIEDNLTGAEVIALLDEHLAAMIKHSPPGKVHALDIEALRAPELTFWTAWDGAELLGCGALKELEPHHGEIKSMRTAKDHVGKGVATAMLEHLVAEGRRRNYSRLSLETGTGPAFEPAHALYRKFGFEYCGPFADYREDSFSRFMALML